MAGQQVVLSTKEDTSLNAEGEKSVYKNGVAYENALGAASTRGQKTVVEILMYNRANIKAQLAIVAGQWGRH